MDDIACDERLQGDVEEPASKSESKIVNSTHDAEARLVLTRPADSVAAAGTTNKLDLSPDKAAVKSVKKGNSSLKSGAIPVWLREEEDEEVEYERGHEDLGSIWLSELYMEEQTG